MQDFHNVTLKFGDIGYNFIIGKGIHSWPHFDKKLLKTYICSSTQ